MDSAIILKSLGEAGAYASVGFAAMGSAIGTGLAGCSAVGAWKKCYAQNKPAPFLLLVYAGAPFTQTIYGMILLFFIKAAVASTPERWPLYLVVGITGGIAMGCSAWFQGKAAAGACDSFAETGKGFVNNIIVVGIIETVAIFTMIFAKLIL